MNPLPKAVGVVATIVAALAGLGSLLQLPFVHAFVTSFFASHPTWSALLAAVTILLAALSHSLPGDGGDGSKPIN
mgnify:CR=1